MKAGWTFGHYPPCKFLLLGFPEEKASGQRVIRDGQEERVVLGERGGTVETKTDTSSSLQPEELWCRVQERDDTKSCHLLLPPPTFPKEKGEKKKERRGGKV